ncbi:hypothetical protein BC939DRAFT_524888 [Gamsiella multidivaricata]|uniref:uncharacterized protein n=1 Tax=Gamsiella multidivaricata TaxID=101098 RepID=UPI00221F7915|nr:uncharacterized protein BC939DRAFT_524888 [Gamsiella multidivaricata]KAI7831770.1 hypothetical protein BC939DRAFT_524888 [Gamsiella multidivaricata]
MTKVFGRDLLETLLERVTLSVHDMDEAAVLKAVRPDKSVLEGTFVTNYVAPIPQGMRLDNDRVSVDLPNTSSRLQKQLEIKQAGGVLWRGDWPFAGGQHWEG